jgi:hypothetical protein
VIQLNRPYAKLEYRAFERRLQTAVFSTTVPGSLMNMADIQAKLQTLSEEFTKLQQGKSPLCSILIFGIHLHGA